MALYSYFCFRRLGILPNQFDDMDEQEKAMVIAFIRKWVTDKRKEQKELEAKLKK